ncbi:HNH endonuclease [Priestia megaterium]|uniref:HNH endonuclease n=1 Tax=Priestia megaterium TaxID=1404 RepID=UPI000BF65752|nr:HNH endonuclease [Priestia megaterium]PFR93490.1 hypothetical protein COK39_17520 [Priestia megaterium]
MSSAKQITFDIDENGCFICTSHKPNKDGYRQIRINKQLYLMHRYIYMQCFGGIPAGMVIRHKCDNRSCINPEHLETGTPRDNHQDMVDRGRKVNVKGVEHGKVKLNEKQVYQILKRSLEGGNMQRIAEEFSVDKSTVFKIKKGETWKHLQAMYRVNIDMSNERLRQNEIWGVQRHNMGKWLAILAEEFGEVAQAMQGPLGLTTMKDTDADDLYTELIQVAAVACAIAEQVKEEQG